MRGPRLQQNSPAALSILWYELRMTSNRILVLSLPLAFAGCATMVQDQVRAAASPTLDCAREKLSVEMHDTDSIAVAWTVRGCRREAECAWAGSTSTASLVTGSRDRNMVCEETEVSKARIAEAAIKDRLALETGCDEAQIKVVKRGAWQKAGQSSWRMEACGQPYVCSSGRTGMDCKQALGVGAQQPQAPAAAEPGMGRCSAAEVTEMKNGGMSTPAIERACAP